MSSVTTRLAGPLLLLALVMAACGGAAGESGPSGPGGAAFDGSFPTLEGGSVDLADFEGQDVVLWFWAPW